MHEDERSKPGAWIPAGWIPIYDEKSDSRPCNCFHCASARKMRMFHQCFIEFFDKWEEKTANPGLLTYADGESRMTQIFVGGMLGDQQEGDKYTTEPCVCHRCQAPRHAYLDMEHFMTKTMKMNRKKVENACMGCVVWDADGRNVRPGPGAIIYSLFRLFAFF